MNPDFAIILNFNLKDAKDVDSDFLVKTARNIGARAVSTNRLTAAFQKACQKYIIALIDAPNGSELTATNVIDEIVANRRAGKNTVIEITVNSDGTLPAAITAMLKQINDWMHLYGHALNESEISKLSADGGNFVLQNRHMHYQQYLFVKSPAPSQVEVTGLIEQPNRIELVADRSEPAFSFENGQLTIDLSAMPTSPSWQIVRIQQHRPEDDIKETKF